MEEVAVKAFRIIEMPNNIRKIIFLEIYISAFKIKIQYYLIT